MKTKKTARVIMLVVVSLCIALLSAVFMTSCSGGDATPPALQDRTELKAGQPPTQPAADHQGRWETMGAKGCMGCHGVNEEGEPLLEKATPLTNDHFMGGDVAGELDASRNQCITCHPVG